jgi:hypothetical protein
VTRDLTTVQLAKRLAADNVLQIRPQAILGWIGRSGYPQPCYLSQRSGQAHLWRYSEVLKWIAEGNQRHKAVASDERELRTRKLAAEVRRAELMAGKLDGTLVDRHGVESFLFENTRLCRDNILAIPARISGLLLNLSDQGQIHRILTTELTKALHALADKLERTSNENQDTNTRGKRVGQKARATRRNSNAGRQETGGSPGDANRKRHHGTPGSTQAGRCSSGEGQDNGRRQEAPGPGAQARAPRL